MKSFAIYSLGCKVNSYESDAVARLLELDNYYQVGFKDQADVYIINTCSVTNMGDAKSRKMIRQAIRTNKDALICVMGCYAQLKPDEISKIDGVDIIIGTQHRNQLVELINKHDKAKLLNLVDDISKVKDFEEMNIITTTSNQRAYLKIQDGCNNYCSYCIIPYARGNIRSRDPYNIINEIKALVNKGYQEIILTGIHTGAYGLDLDNIRLDDLIELIINKVPDLKRLRISSIEINEISDKLINLLKDDNCLVEHLHIPLQAGSDKILYLMKRHYNTKEYYNKLVNIRKEIPNIAITTDLIVGFPNEDDNLFNQTYDFLIKCQFFMIHVFGYSKRDGTPASTMANQVDDKIKKDRVLKVTKLATKLQKDYINSFINKVLEVIVEEYDEDLKMYCGHSTNYIKVYFEGNVKIGSIVKVKIMENIIVCKGVIVNE